MKTKKGAKCKGAILIADYDFGDVNIEQAIIESAGFELLAAQCKNEDEVIEHGRDADGVLAQWSPANPLFQLHNVIITPHAAYYSEESIGTVRRIAAEEAVRVLSGLPALSPVNTIAA